ncbi:MAG: adenosylcobinamide amidohydrolase [Pseudomonadales bacterium]|nr:adenosylcobinamide amidohydrolase [Pseudomonadales bacterium]
MTNANAGSMLLDERLFSDVQFVPISAAPMQLNPGCELFRDASCFHLSFQRPQIGLSSAILNGGLVQVNHLLNLKVEASADVTEAAEITLFKKATSLGINKNCIGMMTAASMNSVRVAQVHSGDVLFTLCVSCGLGNARRVGDKADVAEFQSQHTEKQGTINLVLMVNKPLSPAAMVEAISMISEAKSAVLQQLSVKSPISGLIATGTGTDCSVVICPEKNDTDTEIAYLGKHLHLGQQLGRLVMAAIASAVVYELEPC